MILTHENFTERLAELHPEIEIKSIELIVKKGLQGVHKVMRAGEELLIHNFMNEGESDEWIKFFIKMPPEIQKIKSIKNFYKKQSKREYDAGRKSGSK